MSPPNPNKDNQTKTLDQDSPRALLVPLKHVGTILGIIGSSVAMAQNFGLDRRHFLIIALIVLAIVFYVSLWVIFKKVSRKSLLYQTETSVAGEQARQGIIRENLFSKTGWLRKTAKVSAVISAFLIGAISFFELQKVVVPCSTQSEKIRVRIAKFSPQNDPRIRKYTLQNISEGTINHRADVSVKGLDNYLNIGDPKYQENLSDIAINNCIQGGLVIHGDWKDKILDGHIEILGLKRSDSLIGNKNYQIQDVAKYQEDITGKTEIFSRFCISLIYYYLEEDSLSMAMLEEIRKELESEKDEKWQKDINVLLGNISLRNKNYIAANQYYSEGNNSPEAHWNATISNFLAGKYVDAEHRFRLYESTVSKEDQVEASAAIQELIQDISFYASSDPAKPDSKTVKGITYGGLFEGLIVAKKGTKYGFVDKNYQVVIPFQYDLARPFNNGRACVKKDNLFAYINLAGEPITDYIFTEASDFHLGKATVSIGRKVGTINQSGSFSKELAFPPKFRFYSNRAKVEIEGKIGFIDSSDSIIIPAKFDKKGVGNFYNGRAWFKEGSHFGYIDTSGKAAISPIFDSAKDFRHGQAGVRIGKKVGIINKKGRFIKNLTEALFPMSITDTILGKPTKKWGFANAIDELVLPARYIKVTAFGKPFKNYAIVDFYRLRPGNSRLKYQAIINSDGEHLVEFSKGQLVRPYEFPTATRCGLALIGKKIFNLKQKSRISLKIPRYSTLQRFLTCDHIALKARNELIGISTIDGKELIPPTYKNLKEVSPNIFACNDKQWCLFSECIIIQKNEITSLFSGCFTDIVSVGENKICAIEDPANSNDPWFSFYNNKGQLLHERMQFTECGSFHKSRIPVRNKNKWAIVDLDGAEAIKLPYSRVNGFKGGFAVVGNDSEFSGVVNSTGQLILAVEFSQIVIVEVDRKKVIFKTQMFNKKAGNWNDPIYFDDKGNKIPL